MPTFANKTTVTIAKSKVDIENLCMKYGATEYVTGWNHDRAMIMFTMKGFKARFEVPIPEERKFRYTTDWEQACRQIWRVLLLVLKARLFSLIIYIYTSSYEHKCNHSPEKLNQ